MPTFSTTFSINLRSVIGGTFEDVGQIAAEYQKSLLFSNIGSSFVFTIITSNKERVIAVSQGCEIFAYVDAIMKLPTESAEL